VANYQNIVPFQLAQAAMTTSYATIYTTPSQVPTRTILKDINVINTTGGSLNIYISIVPSGGTAGTDNALFYGNLLPANTTMQWTGSQVMNPNDTLQVKASNVGCTITVSGGEGT